MALSNSQRIAFFKLARRAYDTQQPVIAFDPWRKSEMTEAGLPDSVKKVSKVIGFDTLMRHFAELAYDMEVVEHYAKNEKRLLERVIDGLLEDKAFICERIGDPLCCRALYLDDDITNIRCKMQRLGSEVTDLCRDHGINTGELPTASAPYYFRGKRAAAFAELLQSKTGIEKRKEARLNSKK